MKARFGHALTFLILAGFFLGCDEDPVSPPPPQWPYASPTAPESLITNLQLSYHHRDIKEYAKLLAPEFKFQFQPIDAAELGIAFWTREQDSTGTRALLTTNEVSDIRVSLAHGSRDLSIDKSPPVDSLRIRIVTTDLQVDQTDGITWTVSDQQDLFFRQGREALGEDPNRWFIYEWDDLPSLGSPGPESGALTTWGRLKNLYAQ